MMFILDRMGLLERPASGFSDVERAWLDGGRMAKICVRAESETELLDVVAKAREAGLTVHTVTDAGRTEFHGVPTLTCCAIGPDERRRGSTR